MAGKFCPWFVWLGQARHRLPADLQVEAGRGASDGDEDGLSGDECRATIAPGGQRRSRTAAAPPTSVAAPRVWVPAPPRPPRTPASLQSPPRAPVRVAFSGP